MILAFAPCSTASTCAIESFQRKPNGGNSSSTEYACAAVRKSAITLVKKSRRIARPQLIMQFASVIFGVPRPHLVGIPWHSEGRKIARTGQFGQIGSRAHGDVNGLLASGANNFAAKLFCFPRTRPFLFSSQEDFLCVIKNKILFFH